jgi:DNA-binding transcriptional regulator PaaX
VESGHGKVSIALTREGEQRARLCGAGKILCNNLKIGNIKWDGKWRIVFFDLKNEKNRERDAIRHMLQRCGFIFLQKSVWIYPYDCSSEIGFLRSFFGLSEKEFRLVVSDNIGEANQLKKYFHLSL